MYQFDWSILLGESGRLLLRGAEVTIEGLKQQGLGTRKDIPIKILAKGELTKPLTVHAHAFSASAREQIEAAGGTCTIVES